MNPIPDAAATATPCTGMPTRAAWPNVLIEVRQDLIDTHHGAMDCGHATQQRVLSDMLCATGLRQRGAPP